MTAQSHSELKFEIGHVLFIDIVRFSTLLINQQSDQLETLKRIVRGTEQFRTAEAEGKLLRLPTGDGGALVFRNSPEAPVLCALEIAKALKSHPELHVRMGIHSGPVNEIADLNEQANIAGAGINIAQRVMDCGDSGHILISRHVARKLRTLSAMATVFTSAGRFRSEARTGHLSGELLQPRNRESRRSGKIHQDRDCWNGAVGNQEATPLFDGGNGPRCIDHPWRSRPVFGDQNRSHGGRRRTCVIYPGKKHRRLAIPKPERR